MAGGVGGGGQPGQIQGSDIQNAMFGTQVSDLAMQNRYQQLGLGGQGATVAGPTTGKTKGIPGSGTTPVTPGQFAPAPPTPPAPTATAGAPLNLVGAAFGGTPPGVAQPGTPGAISGGTGPTGTAATPPLPTTGPTAFEMDIGMAPSWTGGIQELFQAALGEGQFQDLGATTQAAVAGQQAKGAVAQGIGSLIGGI